jgi:hypothetical protein
MPSLAATKPVLKLKLRPQPVIEPVVVVLPVPDVVLPVPAEPAAELTGSRKKQAFFQKKYGVYLQLKKRFPECFKHPKQRKRALKIGIKDDILARAPDLDPADVSWALAIYVCDTDYRTWCIAGTPRIDLDGNEVGVVTAVEEAFSVAKYKEIHNKGQDMT